MADDYCAAFEHCKIPAGRVTFVLSLMGRRLTTLPHPVQLPGMHIPRTMLCPYLRITFEQVWEPKEVCNGPIRSVMGLAPGESVVTEIRQIEQLSYTSIVRNAFESSETTSFTRPAYAMDEGRSNSIFFKPGMITAFGSISFGAIAGAFAGAALAGPIGAVVGAWAGNAVQEFASGGSGEAQVADAVDQNLASISRTQTQYTATENTRTQSSSTERSMSRAFTNPYHDRGLDLRFIPVFRHYEVTTSIIRIEIGLSFVLDRPQFDQNFISAKLGPMLDVRLLDPRIRALVELDLGVELPQGPGTAPKNTFFQTTPNRQRLIAEHLNTNAECYGKLALANIFSRGDATLVTDHAADCIAATIKDASAAVTGALSWNAANVVDNCVFLPISDLAMMAKWPGFKGQDIAALKNFPPYGSTAPTPLCGGHLRDVHLYLGARIEPAPGECVLQNVP